MKKIYLITAATACAFSANASVLLNDSFAYPEGSLNSKGQWVSNGSQGSNDILVQAESLTYTGYQEEANGGSVLLDDQLGKNSVQCILAPDAADALTTVYYSALVRVDDSSHIKGKHGALIVLTGSNYAGEIKDGIAASEGGGLYVRQGVTENTVVFGVSIKGSPNGVAADDISWSETEIFVGQTALVAVAYTKGEGADDDTATLYVNPTKDTTMPDIVSEGIVETLPDVRGIALCQRSALVSYNPKVTVDELRVTTEWSELFESSGQAVTVPNISISENPVNFGQAYCNITLTHSVTITATDLTDDITIATGESGQVELSAYTIPMDKAMSPEGFELTISLTPVESRFFSDRITLSTPGAVDKELRVEWYPVTSTVASTLRELGDEDNHDMSSVYVYKGRAVVTFVESYYDLSYDRVVNSIFAQDATGGVELRSATGCGYEEIDITGVKEGDVLTDIVGYLIFGDNGLTMIPRDPAAWTVAESGAHVEPVDVTLRQLAMADNGYTFGNQLVRVSHVFFPDEYYLAGEYHGLWNSQKYKIFDGTLDDYDGYAWMWCNKGADYFKQPTEGYFNHVWTLTGILNNYYPLHISPRSFADFVDEGEREISSGVENVATDNATVTGRYDITGRKVSEGRSGSLVIERLSDGSVRKVVR